MSLEFKTLRSLYIESEAQRLYYEIGLGRGVCSWFNVPYPDKEKYRKMAEEKLKFLEGELNDKGIY